MRKLFLAMICIASTVFTSAAAQDVDKYLTFGPAADWITPIERLPQDFELGQGREINYLLVDKQSRHFGTEQERYAHFADHLISPQAVADHSAVSVNFDPAFQTITFHHLHRIRDGEKADILEKARFDLFRTETDREKLIYNGTLQLSYLTPDIRAGDILDYAYTIHGKNPAFKTEFSGGFQHQFGVPVQRLFSRILVPIDAQLNTTNFSNSPEPTVSQTVSQTGDMTAYTWDQQNLDAILTESNAPPLQFSFPTTMYSTFDDWKSIGTFFAPSYDVTGMGTERLRQIATDIRAKHQTPQTRTRAALDFVQHEIRYLGIELGQGGYIPRRPDAVLSNRFGDCKDMTLLLIAILAELDIKAVPFLVSLEYEGAVANLPPTHAAFDHVIVSASVGGQTYYLDPTRGPQLGDLDHLQQGNFGKGLVIARDGPGMVDASTPMPDYFRDITDTYDLVTEPGAALLTSASTYRKGAADNMLSWYSREGATFADKAFLEYFQNDYPQTEQLSPLQMDIDQDAGEITITGTYRIPDIWDDSDTPDMHSLYIQADETLRDMPDFVGATRVTPYKLPHPIRTRQKLVFALDDNWEIKNTVKRIGKPAFEFKNTELFINNIYTKTVTYESQASQIAPKDFRDTMEAIREARDLVGVTLEQYDTPPPGTFESWLAGIEDIESAVLIWQLSAIFLSLIGAIALRNRDAEWISQQVYYPASVTKFFLLTTVSLGIYPIFWSYKNWRWKQIVEHADVSPGWRAIFMAFTNFALFAGMAGKPGGYKWFRIAATPLAIILFIGIVADRYYSRSAEAQFPVFLFAMTCTLAWLPAVLHVNKLNVNRIGGIQKSFGFGWPAIAMFLLFAPIFALIVYGNI